jgi:hypothetical protein
VVATERGQWRLRSSAHRVAATVHAPIVPKESMHTCVITATKHGSTPEIGAAIAEQGGPG